MAPNKDPNSGANTRQATEATGASEPNDNKALFEEIVRDGRLSTERERLRYEEERFTFQQRRARLYAKSGLFAGQKDLTEDQAIAQAMVRIELGASMGFSDAEALQGIRVINGETSIAAALRAARMQAAGYTWIVEWYGTEDQPTGCRIWPSFKGKAITDREGKAVSVAFLKSDAERMLTTVWENGNKRRCSILEKENWKMSPRNMYFARAITNTQRFYAPGVLSVNLPSIEEAQDFAEPSGSIIPADVRTGTHKDQERVAEDKLAAFAAGANLREYVTPTADVQEAKQEPSETGIPSFPTWDDFDGIKHDPMPPRIIIREGRGAGEYAFHPEQGYVAVPVTAEPAQQQKPAEAPKRGPVTFGKRS